MNLSWSRKIIESLCEQGVEEFVFCAGARNSPLIVTLDRARGIKAYSFFEERSAAFFALGLARCHGKPVAIITTSGTAVAELLPATIEAFHTGVPLVLVTADRPKRLRGTGAPQAIDQTGLFTKFIDAEFDLENGQMPSFGSWTRRAPIHVNVCFDEPLIDEKFEPFPLTPVKAPHFAGLARPLKKTDARQSLEAFLKDSSEGSLMVLVGTLETDAERAAVSKLVRDLRAPTYFEATSGLREDKSLAEVALRSGDKVLQLALKAYGIKRVLRLGGVPTARVWRDLEDPKVSVETFSLSPLPFAGLSRGQFACANLVETLEGLSVRENPSASLLDFDQTTSAKLEQILRDLPTSEPSLVRALSKKIPSNALTYIGNSLPIREWDLAATYNDGHHCVEANRGVNGIDGQVSTFIGLTRDQAENWCVIGDLTALYDLAGPWAAMHKKTGPLHVVVINNGGGKIFHRIFNNPLFENRHSFDFSNWAAQWRWSYVRWTTIPQSLEVSSKPVVIELVPDNEATHEFWNRYDALFN